MDYHPSKWAAILWAFDRPLTISNMLKVLLKYSTLFRSPHDIAISLTGDAIYVAEAGIGGIGNNIHKFEVIRSPSFF